MGNNKYFFVFEPVGKQSDIVTFPSRDSMGLKTRQGKICMFAFEGPLASSSSCRALLPCLLFCNSLIKSFEVLSTTGPEQWIPPRNQGGHHKNEENRNILVKKKMMQLICRKFLGLILREAKRITLLLWCWCRVLVDLLSFYSSNSYKSIKCLVSPLFFKYCSNNMSSNKLLMVERLFFLRTLICFGGTCEM